MLERSLRASDLNPILTKFLSMFEHNRSRLLEMLESVTNEMLDFSPDKETIETIGSLLYHIAGVDWSWVFEDLDGEEMDYETWKHAFALRKFHNISQIEGKDIQFYLNLIEKTRYDVMNRLEKFSDEDLTKEFSISDSPDVQFTLEYMLFHLINHEALHLGQIALLKRLYVTLS